MATRSGHGTLRLRFRDTAAFLFHCLIFVIIVTNFVALNFAMRWKKAVSNCIPKLALFYPIKFHSSFIDTCVNIVPYGLILLPILPELVDKDAVISDIF